MNRQKVLWGLIIVLFATVWISVCVISEQETDKLQEKRKPGEHEAEFKAEDKLDNGETRVDLGYLGHSAFLLTVDDYTILMDPYSPQVGYEELQLEADLITVSHEHVDHNYIDAAPGAEILRGLSADGLGWENVSFSKGEIEIFNMPSYHDDKAGRLRGLNSIFIFDAGDVRIVHLGDLGHVLSEEEIEKLSPVDILLLPVGGNYTIGPSEAEQLLKDLKPSVAVPMHYRTDATKNWPIADVKTFIVDEENVVEKKDNFMPVNKEDLPETTEIWLMKKFFPSEQ